MKVSKLTDYSVLILNAMVQNKNETISSSTISDDTGLPLPTVSKILKLISKANIINSTRGATGGYSIGSSFYNITLTNVIEAIEGPILLTECSNGLCECKYNEDCDLKSSWLNINQVVKTSLSSIKLVDILKK